MTSDQQLAAKLHLVRRDDGWWIAGGEPEIPDMGPYRTKAEAQDDKLGVQRFLRGLSKTTNKKGRGQ